MKHIFSTLLAVVVMSTVFTACKKDHKRISEVKTVPTLAINGDRYISIPVGGTFTDAGAAFVDESGTASTIQADSAIVDVNTPGLYPLTYTRTTESQFSATDTRYVMVTDIPDAIDLSGDYLREATGIDNNLTKVARGLYMSDNLGGSGTAVTAYIGQTDVNTLVIPEQPTNNGPTSAENITIDYSGGDTTISYVVISSGFGTSLRTFVKQ